MGRCLSPLCFKRNNVAHLQETPTKIFPAISVVCGISVSTCSQNLAPFQLIALERIITELNDLLLFVSEHRDPKVAAFAFKGESFLNFRSNDP